MRLPHSSKDDPYSLFSLFFNDVIFMELAQHTNQYAEIKRAQSPSNQLQRGWTPCTAGEIRILFGLWLYMGINRLPSTSDYWRQNPTGKSHRIVQTLYQTRHKNRWRKYGSTSYGSKISSIHELVCNSIGVVRFEQLKRYFHVSDPTLPKPSDNEWFFKMEPLSSKLRNAFQQYFVPGTKVSVDEMMIKFFGRSKHTIKIKHKPIKQGYKVWALSYKGYTYSFLYYSGVKGIGTAEIQQIPGLTPTVSAVYHLATTLPRTGRRFEIFMDNLFTNVPLFVALRKLGIGAAGTTRINASGFPDDLKIEKDKAKSILEWGHLSGLVVDNICCLVWQDNNSVFFMTSFHDIHKTVIRSRRRPKLSSTNGTIVRRVFGDSVCKPIPIPIFIDDYNYNMGGVDIADQLRSYYCVQQTARRNWLPYFYWLLDTTVVNIYQIHRHLYPSKSTRKMTYSHKWFRIQLARDLVLTGKREIMESQSQNPPQPHHTKDAEPYLPHPTISRYASCPIPVSYPPPKQHQLENRLTSTLCLLCRWNHKLNPDLKVKKVYFGCKECNVTLCRPCFTSFHS